MNQSIINICKSHDVEINRINFNQDPSDLIDDIEKLVINRIIFPAQPRTMMSELWNLKSNTEILDLYKDPDFRVRMEAIVASGKIIDVGNYLQCTKFIPCSVIQTLFRTVLLNDEQCRKITELGYGILRYKILKSRTIREVYCDGLHPNLNQTSHQFCLDSEFLELDLTIQNIQLLEELLSHFNIADCYIPASQKNLILEIIDA